MPPEYTDEYCNGPCVSETYLVLNCIEGLVSHYEFYNKATTDEVRETIKSGCSSGPKRGNLQLLSVQIFLTWFYWSTVQDKKI